MRHLVSRKTQQLFNGIQAVYQIYGKKSRNKKSGNCGFPQGLYSFPFSSCRMLNPIIAVLDTAW
jgi:hypothetical protein